MSPTLTTSQCRGHTPTSPGTPRPLRAVCELCSAILVVLIGSATVVKFWSLGRIARISQMRSIATDGVAWFVSVSVCTRVLSTRVRPTKTAKRIKRCCPDSDCRLPKNHVLGLNRGHVGVTWQIRLNDPCVAAMRTYVDLL